MLYSYRNENLKEIFKKRKKNFVYFALENKFLKMYIIFVISSISVLPKSVTVKAISNKVPVEKQNKSYECLIKETNPEFSVLWFITKKDGGQKNITKYISTSSSKSGKLTNLSSKLTLTLKKSFKTLQCLAFYPDKTEFDHYSNKLNMDIRCKFFSLSYQAQRIDLFKIFI